MERTRPEQTRSTEEGLREERAWCERAIAGDRAAYDELVRAHYRRVYTIAFRLLGNPEDAEDLAQESFARGHRALAFYRFEGSFAGWLTKILVHLCQDRFRRDGRRLERAALEPLAGELACPPARDPVSQLKGRELVRAVADHVRALPGPLRIALVLRTLEGLEYEEISAATGVTPATARTRVMKARKLLQRSLAPYFERPYGAPRANRRKQ